MENKILERFCYLRFNILFWIFMFFKRILFVKYFKDEGESINEYEGLIENVVFLFWDMWFFKVEERCVYVFFYYVISFNGDE